MRIITTEKAPKAIGPYSQAIMANSMLFISGQIAIEPKTNQFIGGDIITQTKRVLENIQSILIDAGSSKDRVLFCTVYMKNLDDFAAFNEVYASFFGEHHPARATVEVSNLPKGALIEISAIAMVD